MRCVEAFKPSVSAENLYFQEPTSFPAQELQHQIHEHIRFVKGIFLNMISSFLPLILRALARTTEYTASAHLRNSCSRHMYDKKRPSAVLRFIFVDIGFHVLEMQEISQFEKRVR